MKFGFSLVAFRRGIKMRQHALRPSALVSRGFVVHSAFREDATTLITIRHIGRTSTCPKCGTSSERVHSWYRRRVTDWRGGRFASSLWRGAAAFSLSGSGRAQETKKDH